LAYYLNGRFPGRAIFRLIYFLPYVISEVVIGVLYYQLLQPTGSLNSVLYAVGLGGLAQDWFGDFGLVMFTLFVVITWKYVGLHMVLLLAGLGHSAGARGGGLDRRRWRWQAFRG
jgi:raffinose/stachyose/melibiose transport system permease protein